MVRIIDLGCYKIGEKMSNKELIENLENLDESINSRFLSPHYTDEYKETISQTLKILKKIDVIRLSKVTSDLVEDSFPKGQCKERGAAIVLHAQMLIKIVNYLLEEEDL